MGNATDELLAEIEDLQHDLGKHLLLPVALLPPTATDGQVQAAVARAFTDTKAAQRWANASRAVRQDLALDAAVQRALAWQGRAAVAADLTDIKADFAAVAAALRALRHRIDGG